MRHFFSPMRVERAGWLCTLGISVIGGGRQKNYKEKFKWYSLRVEENTKQLRCTKIQRDRLLLMLPHCCSSKHAEQKGTAGQSAHKALHIHNTRYLYRGITHMSRSSWCIPTRSGDNLGWQCAKNRLFNHSKAACLSTQVAFIYD